MPLDFPSNPVDGQVSGNYIWSASTGVWKATPASATVAIPAQVPPTIANNGDIWIDTSDGVAYFYYKDGDTNQWVELMSSGVPALQTVMPTGSIIQTALPTAPAGWLFCQGQEIQISAFQPLYNAITVSGTVFSYGANTNGSGGAGSTHFRLPDLRGRVPVGADPSALRITANNLLGQSAGAQTHTLSVSEMPSHTHTQNAHTHIQDAHTHSIDGQSWPQPSSAAEHADTGWGSVAWPKVIQASASAVAATNQNTTATNQNTGGGGAHNNLQPYIILNHMIKV